MLCRQQQTLFCIALFGSTVLGLEVPACINTCVSNAGGSTADADEMCEMSSDGFLSDVYVNTLSNILWNAWLAMTNTQKNQWCSASVTISDLIEPLSAICELPESAIADAESKGGVSSSSGSSSSDDDDEGDDDSGPATEDEAENDSEVSATQAVALPVTGTASSTIADSSAVAVTTPLATADTTMVISAPITAVSSDIAMGASGLLTDSEPSTTGSLIVASGSSSAPSATSTTSAVASEGSGSSDSDSSSSDETTPDEGAGAQVKTSVFGAVLAVAVAVICGL
ncbi:hypothetical protein F4778DRAFT_795643 [Xylariomycetidae sp. FL2044]|nr:hypothetical protein F4778DRAFT_795643 [Xylariomycetidae sp. FL2044]